MNEDPVNQSPNQPAESAATVSEPAVQTANETTAVGESAAQAAGKTEKTEAAAAKTASGAIDSGKKIFGETLSFLIALKQDKPKVFYGGIAGIVILLLMLMTGGENDKKPPLPNAGIKNLTTGQQYTLKSANSYDPESTVRLVPVPGALAAYDDTEEADRTGACQHLRQGTKVTALEFQDFAGRKNAFVKVRIEDGECKGNEGWALAIDVQ